MQIQIFCSSASKSRLMLKGSRLVACIRYVVSKHDHFLRKLVKLQTGKNDSVLLRLLSGSQLSLHLPKLDSSWHHLPEFSVSLHWPGAKRDGPPASTVRIVRDSAE